VIRRIVGRPAEFVDNGLRGSLHGIADGQADDIHAGGPGGADLLAQLHEQIGGDLGQTVGDLHVISPFEWVARTCPPG